MVAVLYGFTRWYYITSIVYNLMASYLQSVGIGLVITKFWSLGAKVGGGSELDPLPGGGVGLWVLYHTLPYLGSVWYVLRC